MTSRWDLTVVLIGHLLPLAGVLLWGWQVFDLILLYWLESGAVVLVVTARALAWRPALGGQGRRWAARVMAAAYVLLPSGLFWLFHGLAVVALFGGPMSGPASPFAGVPQQALAYLLVAPQLAWARADVYALPLLGLFLAHAADLWPAKAPAAAAPDVWLSTVMRWTLPMHLTIVAGGFLVAQVGQTLPVLLLFVAVKVAAELLRYLRRRATPR